MTINLNIDLETPSFNFFGYKTLALVEMLF